MCTPYFGAYGITITTMKKKVTVSIKKRKNRKYLQARYRTSSGEWIERSTKTTNRKEATAIGYQWAEAEKKHTMMEQINHYRQNMLWEILTRYLPNLEIKNVNDMYKMVKTMENLRKFEDVQMKHKFWS